MWLIKVPSPGLASDHPAPECGLSVQQALILRQAAVTQYDKISLVLQLQSHISTGGNLYTPACRMMSGSSRRVQLPPLKH
jgi:hypothetical protein